MESKYELFKLGVQLLRIDILSHLHTWKKHKNGYYAHRPPI